MFWGFVAFTDGVWVWYSVFTNWSFIEGLIKYGVHFCIKGLAQDE